LDYQGKKIFLKKVNYAKMIIVVILGKWDYRYIFLCFSNVL
jgi:hypothetical protein